MIEKALVVDLPYPSIDTVGADSRSACIISPAYASADSELNAMLQYIFHEHMFNGLGMEEEAELMESISIAEMKHFDMLGETLLALGTLPIYSEKPPTSCCFYSASNVKYSTTPQKMLMDDITGEMDAIREYENILSRLCNEQVAALIQRIILDEKLHLETLKEVLKKLVCD